MDHAIYAIRNACIAALDRKDYYAAAYYAGWVVHAKTIAGLPIDVDEEFEATRLLAFAVLND